MPTLDAVVMEGGEPIRRALFADMQNDKIVFHTDSRIGIYSLVKKRIIRIRKLQQGTQRAGHHRVLYTTVNPELGTLAVCLVKDIANGQGVQTVFIIWPNGKLGGEEEPLKLSIQDDQDNPQAFSQFACAFLSKSQGAQMLISRLQDGKVYSWRLNGKRCQLVSEDKLADDAGIVAVSDDGCWIALVIKAEGQPPSVEVYCERPSGQLSDNPQPVLVFKENKNPQAMAIQQQSFENNVVIGNLALAETVTEGMSAPPPIEIYSISSDGTSSMIYRLKVPSPCTLLSFCHGVVSHMVSSHADGLAILYDLPRSKTSMCHGSPSTSSLSISADRTLAVATESNCFRVFRVPSNDGLQ